MLWRFRRDYQPHPPPQPPGLSWNDGLFKHYHAARDSKLLIRKGLHFLPATSPSPCSLCLFAQQLFEVFLRLWEAGAGGGSVCACTATLLSAGENWRLRRKKL